MAWTANTPLPGGDLDATPGALNARLAADYPALPPPLLHALARRHGTLTYRVLQGVRTTPDLGLDFGAHLYAREIDYMVEREWAMSAEDILYRRTKAALHLAPAQQQAVVDYMAQRV
jgi:glycerol-3-phosphate dehydrogenase